LGIGDWGLGIGDWGLGPIPNPQSPMILISLFLRHENIKLVIYKYIIIKIMKMPYFINYENKLFIIQY